MKTYYSPSGFWNGSTVMVSTGDEKPYPLHHAVRHSPDGFAWGYGGSGPSELARCIFLDLFGSDYVMPLGNDIEIADGRFGSPEVVGYMDFKNDIVAEWPQDSGWKITEPEIRAWVFERSRKRVDQRI